MGTRMVEQCPGSGRQVSEQLVHTSTDRAYVLTMPPLRSICGECGKGQLVFEDYRLGFRQAWHSRGLKK